jgi:hypothetical protein
MFASFPSALGSRRCVIQRGGPAPFGVNGTCRSAVSFPHGRRDRVAVAFIESWPWTVFHYAGTPRRRQHDAWRFAVLASGRVVRLSQSGDFPPQYVK